MHVQSHSQGIHQLRDAIAAALGLDAGRVTVEHVENAGCYGHNAADDAAFDAVLLARAVPGRPVQVRWSREDELTWGPFASAMAVEVEARLVDGRVRGWSYDVWSQGHSTRPGYAGVPGLLAGGHLADPLPAPAATDPPPAAGGGTTRNARAALRRRPAPRRRPPAHPDADPHLGDAGARRLHQRVRDRVVHGRARRRPPAPTRWRSGSRT